MHRERERCSRSPAAPPDWRSPRRPRMARHADDPQPAVDSPIQADDGTVLAETVRPDESAAGERTCTAPHLFNPLLAFKDRRDYFVAPAGRLRGLRPARLAAHGRGQRDARQLAARRHRRGARRTASRCPPAARATSPEMCVDLNYPTFRFFVAQLEPDTDSELAVDVIYPGAGQEQRPRSQEVQAQGQGRLEAQRRHQARAAAPRQALRAGAGSPSASASRPATSQRPTGSTTSSSTPAASTDVQARATEGRARFAPHRTGGPRRRGSPPPTSTAAARADTYLNHASRLPSWRRTVVRRP